MQCPCYIFNVHLSRNVICHTNIPIRINQSSHGIQQSHDKQGRTAFIHPRYLPHLPRNHRFSHLFIHLIVHPKTNIRTVSDTQVLSRFHRHDGRHDSLRGDRVPRVGFLPCLFLPCCRRQGPTAQCRRRSCHRCSVRGHLPDHVLPFRSRSTTYASRRFDASRSMVRLGRDNEDRICVWRVERILCRSQHRLSEDYTNDWHQLRSMAGFQADSGIIEGRMYTCINMALCR